jgi:hypothetical protein
MRRQRASTRPTQSDLPARIETEDDHPSEVRDHIRYTSGPSMWTQAFFERQSQARQLPAPTGDPRPWRIAGLLLALIAFGIWGYAWIGAPAAGQAAVMVGVGWGLLVVAITALGRAWYLSD